ncbi:three-prime repair exonuclease 1-like [Gigantopelta aegis]|uniref:three-prime repair exonuclease 1-like n=1 Tax=Gigantopelta aegis TaxID=1735272 RepID=UPI001B88805B|nr:three-prime repair exonuclease 1-like [Gigantopelta aegis]
MAAANVSTRFNSFVFFDTETTGLHKDEHRPSITELCLLAVHREDMQTRDTEARVVNKLLVCLNPGQPVQPRAEEMSGLSHDMLESESPFNPDVVRLVSLFLGRLTSPVCLVAHNGNEFDFLLLHSELYKVDGALPESIYCVDSLIYFRQTRESPGRQSFSLGEVYRRSFGEDPHDAHSAEGDCVTLMKVTKESSPDFLQWVDDNAVRLNTISKMY